MGTQLPSPKRRRSPQIFGCGQMAGWIKMPLCREVGLSQSDIVLGEDLAPLPQKGADPNFRPMSIVAKRLAGWRFHLEIDPSPGHIVKKIKINLKNKNWGWCAPIFEGEWGPHLTQCGLGRGLPPRQVSSWSIQPFGHNTPMSQTDRQTDRQTTVR